MKSKKTFQFFSFRLKSDLVKRENDLQGARRELKELQNKFELQQQKEEDLSRKAAKNMSMSQLSISLESFYSWIADL